MDVNATERGVELVRDGVVVAVLANKNEVYELINKLHLLLAAMPD